MQLFIVLEGAKPPVWRRIHVSAFSKLGGLHRMMQAVMGLGLRLFIRQQRKVAFAP